MGNLCVALLLLLSTLSSNPLGSMEQSVPEPAAPSAFASALPLARAPDGAAELQASLDLAPDPPRLQLHAVAFVPEAIMRARRPGARPPDPAPPAAPFSLLERLPYFATAPPALASI